MFSPPFFLQLSRLVRSCLYFFLSCLFFHSVVVLYGAPLIEWVAAHDRICYTPSKVSPVSKWMTTCLSYSLLHWLKLGLYKIIVSWKLDTVYHSTVWMVLQVSNFGILQICLGDILSRCAAVLSNHPEVSLCPRSQRPGLDQSVQPPWVNLHSASHSATFVIWYLQTEYNRVCFAVPCSPEPCLCGTPVYKSQWPPHLLEPGWELSPYLWTGTGPGRSAHTGTSAKPTLSDLSSHNVTAVQADSSI